jgi:N-acetylneuraminic acid mutarotase
MILLRVSAKYAKTICRTVVALAAVISITCKENGMVTRSYPSLDTKSVTEINANGATFNAEILTIGNSGVVDFGFVYSESPNPTLTNSDRISLGATTQKGSFSSLANRDLTQTKTYYVRAYAVTRDPIFTVYGQQVEFVSLGGSTPKILDFIPKEGTIGDTVIITGTGFSNVIDNNRISFGVVTTRPFKATVDTLWCIVPTNLAAGENDCSLMLGQFTVKPASKFLLKVASLTSFSPNPVSFGDTVIIYGTNFPKQRSLVASTLLGKGASVINVTSNQVKAVVANEVNIPESPITLFMGLQTLSSTQTIKLTKPVVNSFAPLSGTKDTEVILAGNYFSPISANNAVVMNGANLLVVRAAKSSIAVKIPSGIPPGNYPLSITVATQSVVTVTQFEIIAPAIGNVSPLNGTWGSTVTITGTNFGTGINDNIVKFGTAQATILSATSTQMTAQVPSNLLTKNSILTVQVITVDNLSATYHTPFVLDPPVITDFTPQSGKSNSLVMINGQNFNPVTANQLVTIGGRTADITSASPNQLIIRLPTSLTDSLVQIRIDLAEQFATSRQLFHLISPWRRVAPFPGSPRADATSFVLNNQGYVGLGYPTSNSPYVWKYDVSSNTWTNQTVYYLSLVNAIAITDGTSAYVGMGTEGGWPQIPDGRFLKYDQAANGWTYLTGFGNDPNTYGVDGAVAYSINGIGYVTTGRDRHNNTTNAIWQYNPTSDHWTRKADMPASSRWEAAGFSIASKAYIFGGEPCDRCVRYLQDSWEYDAISDSWKQLPDFPGVARWRSTGFSINGIGYAVGGEFNSGNSRLGDFWKFDPNSATWTQLEDFPGGNRAGAVVFVINNKAYFGTGLGTASYLNDFWEFDPSKL